MRIVWGKAVKHEKSTCPTGCLVVRVALGVPGPVPGGAANARGSSSGMVGWLVRRLARPMWNHDQSIRQGLHEVPKNEASLRSLGGG
jgi:hypothetical protein